jgi:NADP-dependent 3-hydroxy acid dehydrogenase YdfG
MAADGAGGADEPVVLITGASSGIGAATARRFADEGATVVLAARREERLSSLAADLRESGARALAVPTDVTDRGDVRGLVEAAVERYGGLDVTVVGAAVGERRNVPLPETEPTEFEAVTRTNVDGAFYTTRAVIPALREGGGALIYLGSYKGKHPSTSTPIYAASKWWLRGFAASVAGRVGTDGVGVTVVNPSGVPTEFGSEFREATTADRLDPDATVSAEDVADAVVFAAGQRPPATVNELDLYRRDIHERF